LRAPFWMILARISFKSFLILILLWQHVRETEKNYKFAINKIGKQEVGIWWVQKHFPRYGVPIWSLWPNIRLLPSIVAEKNVMQNEHICSMCIKINKVGKQEVGIWWVQKRYPQYGIHIYDACDQISDFCHQQLLRKMWRKISWTDGRTDGQR
jgi:hypothetical protein